MNNRIILIIPDARTGQARQDYEGTLNNSPPGCGLCLVDGRKMFHELGKRDGELKLPSSDDAFLYTDTIYTLPLTLALTQTIWLRYVVVIIPVSTVPCVRVCAMQ